MKHLMRANSPDNFQTENYGTDVIAPFLPKGKRFWEAACGHGKMVSRLQHHDFQGIGTDLQEGAEFDFMHYRPPADQWDFIVTNPPFSIKEKFIGRCYHLGVPFALLLPLTTFDGVERRKLMAEHGIELVMPKRRINFETPNHAENLRNKKRTRSWFYTVWFTHGLNIGRQITFTD